jgi:hypothetical protein
VNCLQHSGSPSRPRALRAEALLEHALFVTRKTVETHLGRVYGKLDISGRGERVRALAEQGPAAAGG